MTSDATLLDTDVDDEELEDLDTDDEEQSDDDVTALRARIEELEKNPPWLNDLKTVQGRMSAIENRVSKSSDADTKSELLRELRAESSKRDAAIAEALSNLDETAFTDPAAKQKIADLLAQRRDEESRAELRDELLKELKPEAEQPRQYDGSNWFTHPAVAAWESTWTDVLEGAGVDLDSEDMKPAWSEASKSLMKGDFKAASNVMKTAMAKLTEEQEAATKRQNAKQSAGKGAPKGGGSEVAILNDPNKSNKDKVDHLRSLGISI